MKKIVFLLFVATFVLNACSEFSKARKSDDPTYKFNTAVKYYEDADYSRALTLFEDVITYYKGKPEAEDIFYYIAYCNYNQDDYILGGYYFRNFARTFPNSERAEEAQYMSAYCYYLESPDADLDQNATIEAISALELFISQYPNSEKIEQCNTLLDELNAKLAKKSYLNAKLYFDLEYYKAATYSLNNCLNDYPGTPYKEDLMYYITKATYLYASNSIETKQKERFEQTAKDARSFLRLYPDSEYSKEILKIQENTIKQLEKLK